MNARTSFKLALFLAVVWGSLILTARAAPMQSYATLSDAAVAGLADAEALTDKFEAGAAIYQCGASFAYLAPVTDGKRTSVGIPVGNAPGCVLAGMFHTHPRGDAKFSPDDVRGICARNTVGFIKPRAGAVRMLDCRDVAPGAVQAMTRELVSGSIII